MVAAIDGRTRTVRSIDDAHVTAYRSRMPIYPSIVRRRVTVPLLASVGVGVATVALLGPPADAAGDKLTGTITWTRTVAIGVSIPGDHSEKGTETTTGKLTVRLGKSGSASTGWRGVDRSAAYSGNYVLNTAGSTFESGTTSICDKTTAASGNGSGKTAASATVTSRGTKKAVVLYTQPRYSGTATYTITGTPGPRCSPSSSGSGSVQGDLNPSPAYSYLCYPKGSSTVADSPAAYALVGSWNAKKNAFVFDCTKSYSLDDGGRKVTVHIEGVLRWS